MSTQNLQDFENENGPVKRIEVEGDKATVTLLNDIDMDCSPEVRVALQELIKRKVPLIHIDLREVPHMDSSGLATLIEARQRIKRYKGRLILYGLQSRVQSVFEIAKLTDIFEIQKS
jgi:anti-sigma B factor antagonist